MKKALVISFLGLIIFILSVETGFSAIINGSFESGYDGWSIDIKFRNWSFEEPPPPFDPVGIKPPPPLDPAEINVDDLIGAKISESFRRFSPVDGNKFLRIQAGNFLGLEGTYIHTDGTMYYYTVGAYETWTLSQEVYLSKGDTISGYSAFTTSDVPFYPDIGWASINDGISSHSLWKKDVVDVCLPPSYCFPCYSDWEYWEWQAQKSGIHTLSLNQYGDDECTSWSLYDNIQIQPVPEPATILVLGFGLLGLAGFRRKFKKIVTQQRI